VASFPEVQSLRLPKDFGRTKATNIGMRTAKGDFLVFLPAHVEVQPDTVTRLADRLAASDAVGGVLPYVSQWFRLPGPEALAIACKTGELPDPQQTQDNADEVAVDYAPGAPLMVRRMFVRGMNYFDERFGYHWSDLELCWQLRNAGKAILILPRVQVNYLQPPPVANDPIHRADCVIGASGYLGKHFGSGIGVKFRLMATLRALGTADRRLLFPLLSGQKVDGTHL
jgi:GT2 family glycosyltransferase